MNRFNQALLGADARLTVPEPARSRILLEIAADMEDLFQECIGRGDSEVEAEARVLEHFDLSDEALGELVRVHDTPLQRSLEKVSGNVRGPGSQLLMAVLALFVTVGSGNLLFRARMYVEASQVVWLLIPILFLGLVLAGLASCTNGMKDSTPTLLLVNGTFWTGDLDEIRLEMVRRITGLRRLARHPKAN